MIFISKNYEGKVIGIVSAKSMNSVNAYYQGKGLHPHKTEEFSIEEDRENEEMGYVTPIMETEEINTFSIKRELGTKITVVK